MGASSSDVSRITDAARKKSRVISSVRASRRRSIAFARGGTASSARRDSGDWVIRLSEVTVRISHQMRAWFNGPRHFGLRAWSGAVLVLGGSSRDDGDVDVGVGVEGAELVQEAAGAAVGVGFALVPAGAEVGEPVVGAGEQVPDDDEDGAGDGAPGPVAVEAPGQAAEPLDRK